MSNAAPFIPKEKLAAYEFWKMDDFNQSKRDTGGNELLTVEQLEQLQQQAHTEGHAAGYQEGAAQARAELEQLRAVMGNLDGELQQVDQGMANSLVALALEMARQLVRNSLTREPELVVAVVREAMQSLPPFGEHAQLLLNPQDANLVRAHIGEQLTHSKWKLIEDPSIERGGCRVQTAHMEIDGTLPTRWQRMAAGLARHEAWYQDALDDATTGEAGKP